MPARTGALAEKIATEYSTAPDYAIRERNSRSREGDIEILR